MLIYIYHRKLQTTLVQFTSWCYSPSSFLASKDFSDVVADSGANVELEC